jgi:hypothetical protein
VHEDFSRRHQVKMGSERSFGLVMAAGFLILTFAPALRHREPRWWGLLLAAPLAVLAIARPRWLRPLNVAWTRLGLLLNRITSPVILALVFYLAVVPTGVLMRLFGHDPMRRTRAPDAPSYWLPRSPDKGSMSRQF